MLDLLARHGRLDLDVRVTGDLQTGAHHTVEDTAIVLGRALDAALGDRAGIARYGSAVVPMDEARASCAIDISGRPFTLFEAALPPGSTGGFEHELTEEFFRAVATAAKLTLHLQVQAGTNAHHQIEAAFKAFARALRAAVALDPSETGVPSTKGTLTSMSGAGEPRIAVVDYGMGNRRSVEKALERVGARAFVSRDHAELRAADGLLLPGVGAFPAAMAVIRELGLDWLLRELAAAGTPLFGSCMGMQLLFERSEEHGGAKGLGLLRGEVRKLETGDLKLPHIGWSEVALAAPHPAARGPAGPDVPLPRALLRGAPHGPRGGARHGAVRGDVPRGGRSPATCYGAQSHVEKSSTHGLRLLGNFVGLCAAAAACGSGVVILYPAIDILAATRCACQGGVRRQEGVRRGPPLSRAPWVQEGARSPPRGGPRRRPRGQPVNLEHVRRIAGELGVPMQLGGGLRTLEAISRRSGGSRRA